jgi:hypothetical protein
LDRPSPAEPSAPKRWWPTRLGCEPWSKRHRWRSSTSVPMVS